MYNIPTDTAYVTKLPKPINALLLDQINNYILLNIILVQYYSILVQYYSILVQYYSILVQYYSILVQYYSILVQYYSISILIWNHL